MGRAATVLRKAIEANNRRMHDRALDRGQPNPRPLDGLAWNDRLADAHPLIRAEWEAFTRGGGGLPRIEELIDEDQGNDGIWRAGLLVSRGRPATRLAQRFPTTLSVLREVPGLWSALWSVLEAGTELPEHQGPNAGMLRYHLGVVCGSDTALRVGDQVVPYREGEGILFDDTAPHAAWNRGDAARVTLFCELLRPARGTTHLLNRTVQQILATDPRYRGAPARSDAWHAANDPVAS